MTRAVSVRLHRWVGLVIAGFLVVTGLTGAVISWDHELDEWLNPHLHTAQGAAPARSSLDLAQLVETRDPQSRVSYLPLATELGQSLSIFVQPRVDPASGRLYELAYNQIFLDPASGLELGRREWGQVWPITRETLVSFLYKLHFSLHLPEMWGIDRWGQWLLGSIALLWTFDTFVGFYLTLPVRKAANSRRPKTVERQLARGWWQHWKPAWKIKTSSSAYRMTFDLHRAVSLWTWSLLFVLAFTAFSLNLFREVFLPVMSTVSQVTPTPFTERSPSAQSSPIEPGLAYAQVLDTARTEGSKRRWAEPVGALGYDAAYGIFTAFFFAPGDDHGAAGVGPAKLYYDGKTGQLLGDQRPWVGTSADIFVQAQFPVHSGRILGLPGRILISLMGFAIAMLSSTGVIIWWRKRAARVSIGRKRHLRNRKVAAAE